ncbi:hypothetical protein EEB14_33320 [Rhodococcus sp. WS4]|nr:hypothetical protein EEB14_33320 [Rhodococcus sp. WS4]
MSEYFYVTANEGSKAAILAAPFASHDEAATKVEPARAEATRMEAAGPTDSVSPRARRIPSRSLNDVLDITPCVP